MVLLAGFLGFFHLVILIDPFYIINWDKCTSFLKCPGISFAMQPTGALHEIQEVNWNLAVSLLPHSVIEITNIVQIQWKQQNSLLSEMRNSKGQETI